MAEFRIGNLIFTANFDSGNLARVEKVCKAEDEEETVVNASFYGGEVRPDYEFNVWTNPDCAGSQFENGNRSWFYFGLKGYAPGKIIKINIMNMNRQGKLYSQGHSPFTKTVPGKPKWDRIRDRPSWETVDGQFILSFIHRFLEFRGSTTYFAFCFPWSYTESQQQLEELDQKFQDCLHLPPNPPEDTIYYHRDLLCKSLQNQRVDLITISSCQGILPEREPCFDKHLFPDKLSQRCHKFKGKRVFVVSSRVHPGETPASFVFNGFLDFILRRDDKRACQLRNMFVFKLIPMLNPDGVTNGHYRTDTRGVNLNRTYQDPDYKVQPSIYAAKSIIVYHHITSRVRTMKDSSKWTIKFPGGHTESVENDSAKSNCHGDNIRDSQERMPTPSESLMWKNYNCNATVDTPVLKDECSIESSTGGTDNHVPAVDDIMGIAENIANGCRANNAIDTRCTFSFTEAQFFSKPNLMVEPLDLTGLQSSVETFAPGAKMHPPLFSSSDSYIASAKDSRAITSPVNHHPLIVAKMSNLSVVEKSPLHLSLNKLDSDSEGEHIGNEGSDDDDGAGAVMSDSCIFAPHLADPNLRTIPQEQSGIAFYVDLHGHASKRGCFIYGNCLENEDCQVENMLFPKLISLNTAHFDFPGCNFTERNMYARDKKDGMSKEGSGRVATYKSLGLIHSYTLECNYNTGRMVNSVPPACGDNGRATPPPLAGFPPKYSIANYEDVGKALALAALDMYDCNPWSRVTLSEHNSLQGVRDSVRRYLRSIRGGPRLPRNPSKTFSRTSSSGSLPNGGKPGGSQTSISSNTSINKGLPTRRASFTNNNNCVKRELAPVREVTRPTANSRRRMTVPNCNAREGNQIKSNMGGSKSDPNPSTVNVMIHQDNTLWSGPTDNVTLEEEKVEKLRSVRGQTETMRIPARQKVSSRIPILVNRSVLTLGDPSTQEQGSVPPTINKYPERLNYHAVPIHQKTFILPQHGPGANNSDTRPFSEKASGSTQKQEKRKQFDASFNLPVALPINLKVRHAVETPKTDPPRRKSRRLSHLMKRRSVSHSPKTGSGKGGHSKSGSGNDSEAEKRPRRRRRKSRRKSSNTSPSSEETRQVTGLPESTLHGSSVPVSPRMAVNFTDLCLPFPNKRARSDNGQDKNRTEFDVKMPTAFVRRPFPLPSNLNLYWLDP